MSTNYSSLLQKIEKLNVNILHNEPMKAHTTFKVGGPCDLFIEPKNIGDFIKVITVIRHENLPFLVIGNGSDLLISDRNLQCIVLSSMGLDNITVDGHNIIAESGAVLSKVAALARDNELSGLEDGSGIPASVGGAVYMNAGAYDFVIENVLVDSTYVDESGNIKTLSGKKHDFSYRHSFYTGTNNIILSATFALASKDRQQISKRMLDVSRIRREKQPIEFPSGGSMFKRPEGYFAGKLIEDCGLKGYSVGGAQVSEKHAGFVINTGNATADEVYTLVEHVKERIYEKFSIKMETEVKFIGEFKRVT